MVTVQIIAEPQLRQQPDPADNVGQHIVSSRFSVAEVDLLDVLRAPFLLSRGEYVRMVVLRLPLPPPVPPALNRQAAAALARPANNIRQIAARLAELQEEPVPMTLQQQEEAALAEMAVGLILKRIQALREALTDSDVPCWPALPAIVDASKRRLRRGSTALPPGHARHRTVNARFAVGELARLDALCACWSMERGEYVRAVVLQPPPPAPMLPELNIRVWDSLAASLGRLNGLAASLNSMLAEHAASDPSVLGTLASSTTLSCMRAVHKPLMAMEISLGLRQ